MSMGDNMFGAGAGNVTQSSTANFGDVNAQPWMRYYQDRANQEANASTAAGTRTFSNQGMANAMAMQQQIAQGNGPSAANATMAAGTEEATRQQMAAANSVSGGGAARAAAQRNAANQGAQMQAANVRQGMAQRAAEQQAGIQGYSQLAAQGAAQQLQQGQLNNQLQLGLGQQEMGYQQLGFNVGADQLQAQMQTQKLQEEAQQARDQNQSNFLTGAVGGAMSAIGGMAGLSDERLKTGVRKEGVADAFLNHLAASTATFRYKNPSNEPRHEPTGGRYLGVMAQDVERTPEIGHQLVTDTPRGKMIEGGAMQSALAGALGRLHQRVQALEGTRDKTSHAEMEDEGQSAASRYTSDREAKSEAHAQGYVKGLSDAEKARLAERLAPPAPMQFRGREYLPGGGQVESFAAPQNDAHAQYAFKAANVVGNDEARMARDKARLMAASQPPQPQQTAGGMSPGMLAQLRARLGGGQ